MKTALNLTLTLTALAAALSPGGFARADVTPSGTVQSRNGGSFAGGLGDFLLPGDELWVGLNSPGQLTANGGSLLRVGTLSLAQNGGRTVPADGVSRMLITGAGTQVLLDGDGNRLGVAEWGRAELTLSDGATLDGRFNSAACLTGRQWCNNFIGNAAGSDATLTLTGAGTSASFLRAFVVGAVGVASPPTASYTFGTPGGSTTGRVHVLAGALLTTDGGDLATGPEGPSALGTERSVASVAVDGAGSIWRVTGGTLDGTGAFINIANHANAQATLAVTNGGRVDVVGRNGVASAINVGSHGGRGEMSLSGSTSRLLFTGDSGILKVGRNNAQGLLSFEQGAQASGLYYLNVGRDGGRGELTVDGVGSAILVNGTSTAAANGGTGSGPTMDIGRNGTGVVTVSNGGAIRLLATTANPAGTSINLGREAASSGTLTLSGAGSQVQLSALSTVPGGGGSEALNPVMRVGREGSGTLTVSQGGLLWLDGQAVSTVANSRSTSLIVGGYTDTLAGGRGIATVTGAGSEIRLTGNDSYLGVGHGPQSFGSLTVADQARVSVIGINVGRSGGVGQLSVDNATLAFAGQQTGNSLSGAFMSLGRTGGTGSATLANGSRVTLVNPGTLGATLNLGGSGNSTGGGNGSLTLTGGSSLSVQAATGRGAVTVGHDGTGLLRIQSGSRIEVANSGAVFIGRVAGGDGTVLIGGGASLDAAWVGVGRSKSAAGLPSVDGGSGVLVVNDSTVTAGTLEIGSQGYLGGNGLIVGNVINHGVVNPGNSPGSLRIDGSFTAAAGGRLVLEVAEEGAGFVTDSLVFGPGSVVDFSQLQVAFRFLGAADPNAFLASGGFAVGSFFKAVDASGASQGLGAAAFAGASFSAQSDAFVISNFTFDASSGAAFSAQPVPEPAAALLLLLGLVALTWRRQSFEPAASARSR